MNQRIHVSKLSGKLEGFLAINSNPLSNPFCVEQSAEICQSCYAKKNLSTFRKNCIPSFERNSELLSSALLEERNMPSIPIGATVRLNAYGELINETHARNLVDIALNNPRSTFTLWTKRSYLLRDIPKPSNMFWIYSSPCLGIIVDIPDRFDRTFTVYRKDDPKIMEGSLHFHCRGKCKDCFICYSRQDPDITDIREVLK